MPSPSTTAPYAITLVPGLAANIKVAASVNIATGNPALLRDGGISSSNPLSNGKTEVDSNGNSTGVSVYVYNPSPGQTGYTDRLNQLISNLSQPLTFDSSAGAGAQASVTDYATSSASWLRNAGEPSFERGKLQCRCPEHGDDRTFKRNWGEPGHRT